MTGRYFILVDREPVPASAEDWAAWWEAAHKDGGAPLLVARDTIGDAVVSTVFLGLDHGFGRTTAPIVFETLIFGGDNDGDGRRYSTWDEAMAGHQEYVAREREALQ